MTVDKTAIPALGDYVIINDGTPKVYLIVSMWKDIATPTFFKLNDVDVEYRPNELTKVEPDWEIGDFVRCDDGKVRKVENIYLRDGAFWYLLNGSPGWREKSLHDVIYLDKSIVYGVKIKVNEFSPVAGMIGKLCELCCMSVLGTTADALVRIGDGYDPIILPAYAVDIIQEVPHYVIIRDVCGELIYKEKNKSKEEAEQSKIETIKHDMGWLMDKPNIGDVRYNAESACICYRYVNKSEWYYRYYYVTDKEA